MKSKDTQFATVKLPKCLEGSHNTYDRSTNNIRLQHRTEQEQRWAHSNTHDTREDISQKRIHGTTINDTHSPVSFSPVTSSPTPSTSPN